MKLLLVVLTIMLIGAEAVRGSKKAPHRLARKLDEDCFNPAFALEDDCEVCSKCNKERPESLTFIYRSAGLTSRFQDRSTCMEGTYPATATIDAADQTFTVSDGDEFTVLAPGRFDANTDFTINGVDTCTIHTSCSQPLVAGDQFGPFELVGPRDRCEPRDCSDPGCVICDRDNKDFRPSQLTFIYRSTGQNSAFQDEGKASCRADVYPPTTTITVEGQTFTVTDGDEFTVFSPDGRFDANTYFSFSGYGECFIHTSCSAPIVQGDVIGPLEVVSDGQVCLPCENECVVPDNVEYECDAPISINFDVSRTTDLAGLPGALSDDWVGIYPCDTVFATDSVFFPIIRKYVCDDLAPPGTERCWQEPTVYESGTVTIDELPPYGVFGPFIWPVAPYIDPFDPTQTVVDTFKILLVRDDGPSVPPYIPVCESACFTIKTNNRRKCRLREEGPLRLPPAQSFGCFPEDAIVQLENIGRIRMKDLEIGDKVLTANGYEPVYSFGHRDPDDIEDYLMVFSEHSIFDISKEHMVFVEGGVAVPANVLKAGDKIEMADGRLSTVSAVKSVEKDGIYVPFTKSGTIIVNNVKASTFIAYQDSATMKIGGFDTGISFQFFAHSFGILHQAWCGGICKNEQYTENGVNTFVAGPHAATRWLMEQNSFVMACVTLLVFVFLSMVAYPATVLATFLMLFTSTRFRHQKKTA